MEARFESFSSKILEDQSRFKEDLTSQWAELAVPQKELPAASTPRDASPASTHSNQSLSVSEAGDKEEIKDEPIFHTDLQAQKERRSKIISN